MKKIFLTSGLVLCMACPAFATAPAEIAAGANAANCVVETLTTSEAGSTANFVALWTPHTGTYTLDSKLYSSAPGVTGGERNANTAAAPTPLYTIYGAANSQDGGVFSDAEHTTAATALSVVPVMTGYEFGGFETRANDASNGAAETTYISYSNGAWVIDDNLKAHDPNKNASHTLFAKWTPKNYTVTYVCGDSANNGTGTAASSKANVTLSNTATYDNAYSFKTGEDTCELQGYTFNGWICKAGNTTIDQSANATAWQTDSAVTCTAQWSTNTINLTWKVDGQTYSTGSPSGTCIYGTAIETLPTKPTKTGYDFAGWDVESVTPAGQ